jgi:hypothetical protein
MPMPMGMLFRFVGGVAIAIALLVVATLSLAEIAPPGRNSAPPFPGAEPLPGYRVDTAVAAERGEYTFATRGFSGPYRPLGETRTGRHWHVVYLLDADAGQPDVDRLIENYDRAFHRVGGGLVARHRTEGDTSLAVYRAPRPDGSERWMQIAFRNEGARMEMNVVDGDRSERRERAAE